MRKKSYRVIRLILTSVVLFGGRVTSSGAKKLVPSLVPLALEEEPDTSWSLDGRPWSMEEEYGMVVVDFNGSNCGLDLIKEVGFLVILVFLYLDISSSDSSRLTLLLDSCP